MISVPAPGRLAVTEIVGKATGGNGETGSTWNAIAPAMATATVSSVVATGRWMNGAEMFTPAPPVVAHRWRGPAPACERSGAPGSSMTERAVLIPDAETPILRPNI